MKKGKIIKRIMLFVCALCVIGVTSMVRCDAQAATIKLSGSKITLSKKQSKTLTVKGKSSSQKVKWSSTKSKVASVSSKGVVKAKKAGTCYIKAKVGKKTLKCKVIVKNTLKLSCTKKTLAKGKTMNLYAYGNYSKVKWSSTKSSIASITSKSKNGVKYAVIKAKKAGTCYIKAKIGKKTLKCKITVKNPAKKNSNDNTTQNTETKKDGDISTNDNHEIYDDSGHQYTYVDGKLINASDLTSEEYEKVEEEQKQIVNNSVSIKMTESNTGIYVEIKNIGSSVLYLDRLVTLYTMEGYSYGKYIPADYSTISKYQLNHEAVEVDSGQTYTFNATVYAKSYVDGNKYAWELLNIENLDPLNEKVPLACSGNTASIALKHNGDLSYSAIKVTVDVDSE